MAQGLSCKGANQPGESRKSEGANNRDECDELDQRRLGITPCEANVDDERDPTVVEDSL